MPNKDRLRVLLIDDQPKLSLLHGTSEELAEFVELQWLGDEISAKRFLECCIQLDRIAPEDLNDVAPELVIIDYSLSDPLEEYDDFRIDLNRLESKVKQYGISLTPTTMPLQRSDRSGAVLGILISNCFRFYPCLSYPASGLQKGQRTADALLEELEWCLDDRQYKAFDRRGSDTNFNKIIRNAMPSLRARILELAKSQLINISLYDLALLASGVEATRLSGISLTFNTRFGRRSIAIDSLLFLDLMTEEGKDRDERLEGVASAVQAWTLSLWSLACKTLTRSPALAIRQAVIHAKRIWDAFCSEFDSRHELRRSLQEASGQMGMVNYIV